MNATQPVPTNPPREFLPEEEAAAWAGISPRLLRQWAAEKKVKRYRPAGGRRVLYSVAELRKLIKDGEEPTQASA
jgi:hypothetical protein